MTTQTPSATHHQTGDPAMNIQTRPAPRKAPRHRTSDELNPAALVSRLVGLLREAAATHRDPFFLVGEAATLGRKARRRAEYRHNADYGDAADAAADACRALLECASHSAPLAAHARVGCGLLADALGAS